VEAVATILLFCAPALAAVTLEASPSSVRRFEIAEYVVRVEHPAFQNPFTDALVGSENSIPYRSSIFERSDSGRNVQGCRAE